jgi:hypothetical protein
MKDIKLQKAGGGKEGKIYVKKLVYIGTVE